MPVYGAPPLMDKPPLQASDQLTSLGYEPPVTLMFTGIDKDGDEGGVDGGGEGRGDGDDGDGGGDGGGGIGEDRDSRGDVQIAGKAIAGNGCENSIELLSHTPSAPLMPSSWQPC